MNRRFSVLIPPTILNFTFKSLPVLISLMASTMRMKDAVLSDKFFKQANSSTFESFDFIVVGGGSAGSVVAARLSEDPKVRVLLLEAGGNPIPFSYVAACTADLQGHPDTDWIYETEPQNGSAEGLQGNKILWPRGKSLGGSSATNFMIYMRGNPHDFDRWAYHTDDVRWSYKEMEKYFKKIEDYHGQRGERHRGKGGPMHIQTVNYAPGVSHVLKAAKQMGYANRDLNKRQKQGFSKLDMTMKRGLRHSTFNGYLKPGKLRRNLVIYRYSHVTKIHIDDNGRAVGVRFVRHGVQGYAHASKEIIVSAGAINSPQLLMLSGIGPKEHLEEKNIPVVADLPVGLNLQDHVATMVGPFLLNRSHSFMVHRDIDVGSVFNLMIGKGPLTSNMGLMAAGLAASSQAIPNWPDIMFTVASFGASKGFPGFFSKLFNVDKKGENYLASHEGYDAHMVIVALGLPNSRGFVRLRDKNPFSKPIINPRYYSDENGTDIDAMVEGVGIAMNIYENGTALKKLGSHLARSYPGCEHLPFKSKSYNECLVRKLTLTFYDPSGTCSMGKSDDPGTVVDSKLRVLGVKRLRVADASVMPFVTNSNTNGPSIAIGEVCADIIKEAWKIKGPLHSASESFLAVREISRTPFW